MRYYIILQPSIRSMGGEEIYTRNKVIEAKKNGYVPIVFHGGIGDKVLIDDLKYFDEFCISELRYEPCTISHNQKKKVIDKIKRILVDYDSDSIIESHEIIVAEWGEFFASTLKISHFIYLLLEHHEISNEELYLFFKFKYDRHELVGIFPQTLKELFCRFPIKIEGFCLPAHCNNSLEELNCPSNYIVRNADFTIGTVGRTDKQYVIPMIESIVRFIRKYPNKTFNVLYIGGSMNKRSEQQVKKILNKLPNVELYFTGMIFPIPISMIRQADVCLCSSGSCSVTDNCGVPTISIDGNDSKGIGIYNRTTQNCLFRGLDEPPIEIDDMLESILIKKINKEKREPKYSKMDWTAHWDFVNEMSKKQEYFDVNRINYSFVKKLKFRFLGYYYGTKPGGILNTLISKALNLIHS